MTAVQPTAATDPDGPTGKLATWVANLTLDDVPQNVVERAKHLLLDGIGCALIGSQLPWSRVATGAVLDLENKGDVVVIGTGQCTSGPAAAVLNGTFIQGFELDDFHPIAPVHSCSLVIPALLSTVTAQSGLRPAPAPVVGAALSGPPPGPAAVSMPTTWPLPLTSGPPESPSWIAALVSSMPCRFSVVPAPWSLA